MALRAEAGRGRDAVWVGRASLVVDAEDGDARRADALLSDVHGPDLIACEDHVEAAAVDLDSRTTQGHSSSSVSRHTPLGTLRLRRTSFTVSCRKLLHFVAAGALLNQILIEHIHFLERICTGFVLNKLHAVNSRARCRKLRVPHTPRTAQGSRGRDTPVADHVALNDRAADVRHDRRVAVKRGITRDYTRLSF